MLVRKICSALGNTRAAYQRQEMKGKTLITEACENATHANDKKEKKRDWP